MHQTLAIVHFLTKLWVFHPTREKKPALLLSAITGRPSTLDYASYVLTTNTNSVANPVSFKSETVIDMHGGPQEKFSE